MPSPIGVAVVGAGTWGRNLVRVLASLDGFDLVSVCDKRAEALADARGIAPHAATTTVLADVLADRRVSVVAVAVEASSHVEVARAALLAGKHVFVEKPMTLSTTDAAALLALSREVDRVLMVGHLMLFHPAVVHAARLVSSGALGDLRYLAARRLNPRVKRSTENAWWSLAPHDVAVALWLTGETPVAISAVAGAVLGDDPADADVVFATLHFPGGTLAHLHVSRVDAHKTRTLAVVGTNGMIELDDTVGGAGLRIDGALPAAPPDDREPLAIELAELRDAIVEGRPPRSPGELGLAVVRVLAAGEASLRRSGARVELGA
jgi:predicted dehydrogenase